MCKVWLGRTEGKEEEKSNPLTSKSCTTGISREGGHAATKHRETEITITEAPRQPSPNHRAKAVSGARGAVSGGHACQRLGCRGEAKPGALWGLDQRPGVPDTHAPHRSHVLTGLTQRLGRTSCSESPSSQAGPQAGHCAASQGPTVQNRLVQITVLRPSLVSYLGNLMGLS